jgi:hypothetical protein
MAWSEAIERGGVVFLLVVFILGFSFALTKRWLVPGYVVTMLEKRIAQLEERERELLELTYRAARVSTEAVESIQQRQRR